MIAAGFGFRGAASVDDLAQALAAAVAAAGGASPDLLATAPDKAGATALTGLAARLGLPLRAVPVDGIATPTDSDRVRARFGTGSLAEAAALSAAGPGARLIAGRQISDNGMAVAALAATSEGTTE
ncbi:cobalamin biosynthesis protein [Paracoccus zhouxuedongae]|uniref:cobalamin biosynthesis protein n=1 Tax=Paracoccus sp. p4-l81 TaxID=3342806 RepID=UPI0035BC243B